MAPVSIQNVRKAFGALEVISDFNLDVQDGEFVALVGPSGCGKSTILRMLAGLEPVTSGNFAIDGKSVNNLAPKDRDIAMVFQNYALYPNKTVAANMGFPLRMRGLSRAEIDDKVNEVAHVLGLENLLGRYPRHLSGGQRQRVAMGRAIVRNPKVFLFDEPLSNLDAKLRVKMRAEIKELHQRLKTTTIYVTHDQVEAMTMADKIVVMRDGKLEQTGRPLELYDAPENRFVAGFIGSPAMNFLEGEVARREDRVCFSVGGEMVVSLGEKFAPLISQAVTLGIRPEHISIHDEPVPDATQMYLGVVEPTGAETTFILKSGDAELVVVKQGRFPFTPGTSLWVSFPTDKLHVFDTTGNAVAVNS